MDHLGVGKAAIAAALIPRESTGSLFHRPDGSPTTYDHIWHSLRTEPRRCKENRLRVVTFNYDRSLEEYLARALENSYGLNHDEVSDLMGAVPIVHIHGVIGSHPRVPAGPTREYQAALTSDSIKVAAAGIRILHEAADTDAAVRQARELIQESERVVFLGFGYDPQNVKRLGLEHLSGNAALYGSAFGLTDPERVEIRKSLGREIVLGDRDWRSLRFLRERVLL